MAIGNNVRESVSLLQDPLEPPDLRLKPAVLEGLLYLQKQFVRVKGFRKVVESPHPDRLNSALDAAMGRENDNGHFRIYLMKVMHQGYPIHPDKSQVNDSQIEDLFSCSLKRFFLIGYRGHFIVRRLKHHAHQFQQVFIVIDN
ncbi:MAG: hypothetical protein A4E64_01016 [Syntrophorhabdus sp. PtaU1.Bin058]|nr:MAG: hypothetical protein A4E64_01016 [Syntrophorhabdus sp. PtaU1.Bin058]